MTDPVLSVRDLEANFETRGGTVRAVDGVSFDVGHGETLGLAGESGCGKSSLGRAIVGLVRASAGSIRLNGTEVAGLNRRAMRSHRPTVQMVFQDPYGSLNPRLTIGRIIEEPLLVHRRGNRVQRRERVQQLMRMVGLRPEWASRHPHEFSGGQRQRVGIARALALDPRLLICDEPVSALDVSVQAQVINLLVDLQRELGLSYLFISHDLSVLRHLADRILVMYLGKIVEVAPRREIWARPLHPYTQGLIEAVPLPDPASARTKLRRRLAGEIPSPFDPPSGCRFRTRCPYAIGVCVEAEPPLRVIEGGRQVACHLVTSDAAGPHSPRDWTVAALSP
jgi:oligopeptide/dipeptide ABC transporter ATP-binding protein